MWIKKSYALYSCTKCPKDYWVAIRKTPPLAIPCAECLLLRGWDAVMGLVIIHHLLKRKRCDN